MERVEGVKGLRWRKREAGMVMCGSKWLGGRGSEEFPPSYRRATREGEVMVVGEWREGGGD